MHEGPDRKSQASLALAESDAPEAGFSKGQVLFAQGQPADALFFIRRGKIKMNVLSEHGKEGVIAILEAGDFCGENCLAGQSLRTASAKAMTDGAVLRIERATALRLLKDNPEFGARFLSYVLARNLRIEADLIDQLFNSSEKRLARLLLILGAGKNGSAGAIDPPISQEMLAEMIGTTRSRVSHFMNRFRQLGYISYNGHSGQLEVHKSLNSVVLEEE
ncbi:Crp/Fnr family transcriptional regulator [Terrihabitans soli]|uniref:Crp/Fnr family transcriptional regulator n=1 Tax=Terrihabitans soli TaxID=708113 RepID=A0A6S6QZA7_9HYPH|nr:Crp/Fnr family transcriptional regulator [Terrihabitans soli]BCJ92361.1 Crp/Fnr family transcriptional regulator [Terrihabitans soli]